MSSQAAQTFTLTQWQAWDPARPQIWKSCAPAGIVISITTSGDLVSGIHQGGAGSTSVAIGRPVARVPAADVPDAHRGSRRPAEVHPRSRREAVVQDPAQPMGSRKARNNTFLRLPAYAASAFSSQGPSIPNRSCDRTTGVVLRGTESLLTHRWSEGDSNSRSRSRKSELRGCGDDPMIGGKVSPPRRNFFPGAISNQQGSTNRHLRRTSRRCGLTTGSAPRRSQAAPCAATSRRPPHGFGGS